MHNEPDLTSEAPAGPAYPHRLAGPANILAAIGTGWIFLLMVLVVADVVGRNFLNAPITGVSEFAARSVASIVFLQLATAICMGRMTRSDFLLRLIGGRWPGAVRFLEVVNVLFGATLFLLMAWIAWPELTRALEAKEFFGVQGVFTMPTWPFRALIVIGGVFAGAAYLLCIPALLRPQQQQQSSGGAA